MRDIKKIAVSTIFLAILTLAAWLRLEAALHTVVDMPIRADARDYAAYGYNMRHFGIYSRQVAWRTDRPQPPLVADAMRQPAYPLFLALFLGSTPDENFVHYVVLSQACIGIAIVALVFWLAFLLSGATAALAAMFLTALSPHLIVMESYVLSETLFALIVLAMLLAFAQICRSADQRRRAKWALVSGILLALSCYVRPTLEHFALVGAVTVWVAPGLRSYRREAIAFALAFGLASAPWWLRNLLAIGHLSDPLLVISTLHHGSYPDFIYNGDLSSVGYPYEVDPSTPEVESSIGSVLGYIFNKFAEQPWTYLRWYLVGKIQFFFDWNIVDGYYDVFTYPVLQSPYYSDKVFIATHALMRGLHWPLMIASMLGAIVAWIPSPWLGYPDWRVRAMRLMSCVMLYTVIVHVVGAPYPRYSIPFRPLQYLLAIYALLFVCRWVKNYRQLHGRA